MSKVFTENNLTEGINQLASLMKLSKSTVILTGAGMDTESNIPDFRSKGGWWRQRDPRLVASIDNFYENYPLFHEFYTDRIKQLEKIKPHEGHYILARLERQGLIESIATQNIAGLHNIAGNKKIYELHGNIRKVHCHNCKQKASLISFLNKKTCTNCGHHALRPSLTLFGERLPQDSWNKAIRDIEDSSLLLVIGTSLEVSPVNQLPTLTNGKSILINRENINRGYNFEFKLLASAGKILKLLEAELKA